MAHKAKNYLNTRIIARNKWLLLNRQGSSTDGESSIYEQNG